MHASLETIRSITFLVLLVDVFVFRQRNLISPAGEQARLSALAVKQLSRLAVAAWRLWLWSVWVHAGTHTFTVQAHSIKSSAVGQQFVIHASAELQASRLSMRVEAGNLVLTWLSEPRDWKLKSTEIFPFRHHGVAD